MLLWRRAIDYTLSGYGDLNYEVQNIELTYFILYMLPYHNISSSSDLILPQNLDTQKYLQNVQKIEFSEGSSSMRISAGENLMRFSGRKGCHTRKIFPWF